MELRQMAVEQEIREGDDRNDQQEQRHKHGVSWAAQAIRTRVAGFWEVLWRSHW